MKKNFLLKTVAAFLVTLVMLSLAPVAFAQILPDPLGEDCDKYVKDAATRQIFLGDTGFRDALTAAKGDKKATLQKVLGCAVKTGRIRLYMMPFFITYLSQFLLEIAGLVSILFVVIGGYRYTVGGISDDKEGGKKTITMALIGLVVSFSAWIIVNLIQVALTSYKP